MSTTTVTATYTKPNGDPAAGRVIFQLVAATYHDGLDAIFPTVPVAAVLDAAGGISVELEPTSGTDADFDATDLTYQVTEKVTGANRDVYYVDIPTAASVDLGTLTTYDDPPGSTRELVVPDLETLGVVMIAARPVNARDHAVNGTVTKASLTAALAAAEAAGGYGTVELPDVPVDVTTGFSMSGYTTSLTGQGTHYASSAPRGSILKASTQTGPVLDMTGFVVPSSFRGQPKFSGFGLQGSGAADATKVNVGLLIDALYGTVFENIVIQNTGGAGVKASPTTPGLASYFNTFREVTVIVPVSAKANDVPYWHMKGSNGNLFDRCGMYGPGLSNVGASGAVILEDDGTYMAHDNKLKDWWVENLEVTTSGTIFQLKAVSNIVEGVQFFDVTRESGVAGTSYFRLSPAAVTDYGGNTIAGNIPGDNAGALTSISTGVHVQQSNNRVVGTKGYQGGNVLIDAGIGHTFIDLGGSVSTATGTAVTDNSGTTTNTFLDRYNNAVTRAGVVQATSVPADWTSYTPTLAGTGWALGNGTITGAYVQIGKTVHFKARLVLGTTSTAGASATPTFTLPVTAADTQMKSVTATLVDASTNEYQAAARTPDTSTVAVYVPGTNGVLAFATASVPFAFGTSDRIEIAGTYRAA